MTRIPVETLLAEPRYFLHRVDLAEEQLTFVDTTRARLAAVSFLDGRSAFGEANPIVVPLSSALDVAPRVAGPDRLICHASFCGSTLLARLFDVPGRAFSYKEPQALVDLADSHAAATRAGRVDTRIAATLDLVLAQLRLRWTRGEATVIKPSNWVNALLAQLASTSADLRLVLCDIEPRDFLRAIFRGGRERIAYTLQVVNHMHMVFPGYGDVLADASSSPDPLTNVACLTLVALHLQHRAFDMADPFAARRLYHREIVADPAHALRRAASMLDVPLSADEGVVAIAAHGRSHAKSRRPFDIGVRDAADNRIEALHGARFDAALAWSTEALPAQTTELVGATAISYGRGQ
jgi:hypothetical protein